VGGFTELGLTCSCGASGKCHTCTVIDGIRVGDCLACANSRLLHEGACLGSCPDGFAEAGFAPNGRFCWSTAATTIIPATEPVGNIVDCPSAVESPQQCNDKCAAKNLPFGSWHDVDSQGCPNVCECGCPPRTKKGKCPAFCQKTGEIMQSWENKEKASGCRRVCRCMCPALTATSNGDCKAKCKAVGRKPNFFLEVRSKTEIIKYLPPQSSLRS